MSTEENALVDQVRTRDDFVRFVRLLATNAEADPKGCPNDRTAVYLDAMAAWTADMDGYFKNIGESAPTQLDWGLLAKIVVAAKYYE